LSRLTPLIAQVSDEIHNEERRVELVNKIVLLAKMGLQSAGLPMLS
jgi:hypothetical protein